MRIKHISLFIAAAMLLTGCTAGKGQNSSAPVSTPANAPSVEEGTFSIAYSMQDGFNPYLSESNLTLQVADLLFEQMINISPHMVVEYRCISSVSISGLTATLTPDTSYRFTDGTAISALDIAACIEAGRTCAAYSGQLANIDKTEVVGSDVIITLKTPDSMFAYLLNLPVIKASELASRTPTCNGRYTYGGENLLIKNDSCNDVSLSAPNEIHLTAITGYDEIINSLSLGSVSLYITELENSSASSTTSLQTFYKINNLVFLGLNALKEGDNILSSSAGRRAVNSIIDRGIIAEKCYYSRAYPATGAFNPTYPCLNAKQALTQSADLGATEGIMNSLGYKKDSIDGYYKKGTKRLELNLLVFSGSTNKRYIANTLKEHFSQNGIYINLDETDNFDIYTQKIVSGEFDMYIGEVKLYNNMDLMPFMSGGAAASGIAQSETLNAAYEAFKQNAELATAYEKAFSEELPYIPLVWRCGTLVTAKNVHGIVPSVSNAFYDINELVCDAIHK
ncbi:MAG: ABC transporter substrate-binding protein [Oscillospiraceae bacterium]